MVAAAAFFAKRRSNTARFVGFPRQSSFIIPYCPLDRRYGQFSSADRPNLLGSGGKRMNQHPHLSSSRFLPSGVEPLSSRTDGFSYKRYISNSSSTSSSSKTTHHPNRKVEDKGQLQDFPEGSASSSLSSRPIGEASLEGVHTAQKQKEGLHDKSHPAAIRPHSASRIILPVSPPLLNWGPQYSLGGNDDSPLTDTNLLSSSAGSSDPPDLIRQLLSNDAAAADGDEESEASSLILTDKKALYVPALHLPSAPTRWLGYEPSTPLTEDLIAYIGVTGRPLSVATYWQMALTHPQHGYYTTAQTAPSHDDFDDDDHHHPDDAPSTDATIIGPGGDFITAPEISQIFAESVGVWFYTQWQEEQKLRQQRHSSSPSAEDSSWQWLECGPGRGSLMVDLLRFTLLQLNRQETNFGSTLRAVHLIEMSPALRQQQLAILKEVFRQEQAFQLIFHPVKEHAHPRANLPSTSNGQNTRGGGVSEPNQDATTGDMSGHPIHVYWHESWGHFQAWQMQQEERWPTFGICQEFIDALPVYVFEKTEQGYWRERQVDVALREDLMDEQERARAGLPPSSPNPSSVGSVTQKPRLRLVLASRMTPAVKTLLGTDEEGFLPVSTDAVAPLGCVVEVNPQGILLVKELANLIDSQGGAALIIDYGQEGSTDSIRGFAKHKQVPFLSRPGQVDITADVDFAALKHAVNNRSTRERNSDENNSPLHTKAYGPVTQGQFLLAMGAADRVESLLERDDVTEDEAENLYQALVRLASPEEMGERYKVLAITRTSSSSESAPPGFDN